MTLTIDSLAKQINEAASKYQVGGLQQLRAKLHGKRARTNKIFHKATVFPNYAFHDGGRTELQFNIGVESRDDGKWWRHGVAFSFERGQSLPDPTVLFPRVDCFNEWVRINGDRLRDFKMWHWDGEKPSKDRLPGDISRASAKMGAFVFLGDRVAEAHVDVDRILQDFDRLYPLYEYVESRAQNTAALITLPEEVPENSVYNEGAVKRILVNCYERDVRARQKCLEHYGTACVLCGFDFGAIYGEVVEGLIHVHHLKQLSSVGPDYEVDPISDLCPLCANCHVVVHRREPPYSLDEVRMLLQDQSD